MTTSVPGAVPVAGATSDATRDGGEDLRLARLHLRLGMVAVARAELEDLDHRGELDVTGRSALAEARWRGGDLDGAAAEATRHLEAGGTALVAIVIVAEAAAAAGEPADARRFVERAAKTDLAAIDTIFAGIPRRASWPAATVAEPNPTAPHSGAPSILGAAATVAGTARPDVPTRASAVPTPADVLRANASLWDGTGPEASGGPSGNASAAAEPPSSGLRSAAPGQPAPGAQASIGGRAAGTQWVEPARPKGHADPEREVEAARAELEQAPERGLLRLALVLRLDPTLATEVFESVRLRREPLATLIRGDAERLMGRHLEAEADFGEAMETIEREVLAARHHSQPEAKPDQPPEPQAAPEPEPQPETSTPVEPDPQEDS